MSISSYHWVTRSGFATPASRRLQSSIGGKSGISHCHPVVASRESQIRMVTRGLRKQSAKRASVPISRASHASIPAPERRSIEATHYGRPGASRAEARKSGSVATPATELCRSCQRVRTTTVPTSTTPGVRHSSRLANCEGRLTWV